jgi:transglutaminase-like putative cysteine protease
MRVFRTLLLAVFILVVPTARAETPAKAVHDTWNAAFLERSRAGYVHNSVQEIERDGKKLIRVTSELKLTVRRNGGVIVMRMESGDEETPDGKILGVFMKQFQGDEPVVQLRGTVVDKEIIVRVDDRMGNREHKFPWDDRAIGMGKQERMFKERNVKPGDRFSYLSYEPMIDHVVAHQVSVGEFEEVEVRGVKKRFLRVDSKPDKLPQAVGGVQLPGLTTWLDNELLPVVSRFEVPLLGMLTLTRTTAREARTPALADRDIFPESLISVGRVVANPNGVESAVFRITVRDEAEPEKTFAQDNRQDPRHVDGNTLEVHVHAKRRPEPDAAGAKPGADFLSSCHFIDSDDPKIKAYAKQATTGAIDDWSKARRIERWVHNNMNVSFTETFGPASQVARTFRGDCRQHALLTAALCRAAGIPARTAIGLVYANDRTKGPVMAFHMWTEVWVQGQWLAIDATRGEGSVGAMHLKVTDSSWANTPSMTPLLPLLRVLGKLSIEVVSVDGME